MASISNVTITSGDTTLILEGTGTYDADTHVVVCVGKWDSEPSVDSSYTINFESVELYGQPFTACVCTDFEEGGEATGTFTSKE